MLKRVGKLLLASILMLTFMSPAMNVANANAGGLPINIRGDDPTNQLENDQASIVELDQHEEIDGEIEDEMLNEEVETLEDELSSIGEDDEALEDELNDEDDDEDDDDGALEDDLDDEPEAELSDELVQIGIIFPDPGLALMIAGELDLTVDSYILREDLAAITNFFVNTVEDNPGVVISSIAGIQYLVNLQALGLVGHEISDISPLASLTNLNRLELMENRISDISPLANLTNLTSLNISYNQISDISPLANLTNLELLFLMNNHISDITALANLNNLRTLSLMYNEISDVSVLAKLVNLRDLGLEANKITDLRPLGNLNLSDFSAEGQVITLPTVTLGEGTRVEFFLRNGSRVNNLRYQRGSFDYDDGILTWWSLGSNATYFRSGTFSATIYQEVTESENDGSTIPQSSIALMRAFIEDNSAESPFIVPAGFTFNEALNELDWGEGITVWTRMSGFGTGSACGTIVLYLNKQINDEGIIVYDDYYRFWDKCIYYEFEPRHNNESQATEPKLPQESKPQPNRPGLPQTGSRVLNASLIGGGILTATGLIIYLKNKVKIKD